MSVGRVLVLFSSTAAVLANCALAVCGAPRLEAGPPILSDDPETPGDKHWEVNVSGRATWSRSVLSTEAPLLDVNYGLGERWQLKFEIPFVVEHERGEDSSSGVGDATFGVKWRFLDQVERGLSMSVYPQLKVESLASFGRLGNEDREPALALPLQVAYDLERWNIGADAGRWTGHREDGWFGSIWASKEPKEGWEVLGELHAEIPDRGRDQLILDVGMKARIDDHTSLMFSAGIDLLRSDGGSHEKTVFLGLQFNF